MQQTIKSKGFLEVICGPMFSGKSEELIRRLRRAQFAKLPTLTFKHISDNERLLNNKPVHEHVASHNGTLLKAIAINEPEEINYYITPETLVIGIDEIQFFSHSIINVICDLINNDKRVIVAGLDLDFKGVPFGPMPILLSIADFVTKLQAICIHCGKDAHFTQRLVNGNPARYDDPIVLVGAQESYQARCRACHSIDRSPVF